MGGYYRSFKKIYVPTTHGIAQPYKAQIKEPLDLRFPYQVIFEKVRHHELEKWSSANSDDNIPYQSKTIMMMIGNTFVRLAKTNGNKDSNETISTKTSQLSAV